MKILVTAFEEFGNVKGNSSLEVLKRLDIKDKIILPVSYKRSKEELAKAVSNIKPDFVLCLGQAGKESKIRIEMLGINYTRESIPDNDGVLFDRGFVKEGGSLALRCNLNIEDIVAKLNKKIPCYLSLSAGAYICNTTY